MDTVPSDRIVRSWRFAFVQLAALSLGLLFVYQDTFLSMFRIWLRSETFAHGLVVVPISMWLIWRKWPVLKTIQPRPDSRGLVVLLLLALAWLLADVAEVSVGRQLAVSAMLIVSIFTLLGWSVVRNIQFPLLFLLFAVPMGEDLIPPLMNFTAAFVVNALQLTGIPVYWEGLYFSIPSGDWNVVEGCSGVRYLIASITLGSLYAYLTYRSYWRRTVFILCSIIVPVFANGMRAYIIVMIAHLSDMQLALGVDHFIYGWVFFGLVILIMFWAGSFWAQPERVSEVSRSGQGETHSRDNQQPAIVATVLVAAIVVSAPLYAHLSYQSIEPAVGNVRLSPVPATESWQSTDALVNGWTPTYRGAAVEAGYTYRGNEGVVGVYLAHYPTQRNGSELISSQNMMIPQKHPVWGESERKRVDIVFNGEPLRVFQSKLKSRDQRLLIWHWYHAAGKHTSNPYTAKLSEALRRLSGGLDSATGVVVYAQYEHEISEARTVMQAFLDDMGASLDTALAQVSSEGER